MHEEIIKDLHLCTISKEASTVRGFHDKFLGGSMPNDDFEPLGEVQMIKKSAFLGIIGGKQGIFLDQIKAKNILPMIYKPVDGQACFVPLVDKDNCIPTAEGISYPCVELLKNSDKFKKCAFI
jgi:hypothetical protein